MSKIEMPAMTDRPEFVAKMVALLATNPDPEALAREIWEWGRDQNEQGYQAGNLGDFYADL